MLPHFHKIQQTEQSCVILPRWKEWMENLLSLSFFLSTVSSEKRTENGPGTQISMTVRFHLTEYYNSCQTKTNCPIAHLPNFPIA